MAQSVTATQKHESQCGVWIYISYKSLVINELQTAPIHFAHNFRIFFFLCCYLSVHVTGTNHNKGFKQSRDNN